MLELHDRCPDTQGGSGGEEVQRGAYWRSVIDSRNASRTDLSNGSGAADVRAHMDAHRKRDSKLFQVFGRGAGTSEKIGTVAPDAVRYNFSVKLLEGAGLMSADDNGMSDPYCDLHVWCPDHSSCEHMWRSDTQNETLQPKWDKRDWQRAPLTSKNGLLHLVCFDWDRSGKDDFLGEALVDLSRYTDGRTHRLKLMLDQYDTSATSDKVSGWVMVEIQIQQAPPRRR